MLVNAYQLVLWIDLVEMSKPLKSSKKSFWHSQHTKRFKDYFNIGQLVNKIWSIYLIWRRYTHFVANNDSINKKKSDRSMQYNEVDDSRASSLEMS